MGLCGGSVVKNPPATQETWVWSLSQENPLEKEIATHFGILAWKIPQTEEPGGLQSMGSQKKHTHIYLVPFKWQSAMLSYSFFFILLLLYPLYFLSLCFRLLSMSFCFITINIKYISVVLLTAIESYK